MLCRLSELKQVEFAAIYSVKTWQLDRSGCGSRPLHFLTMLI